MCSTLADKERGETEEGDDDRHRMSADGKGEGDMLQAHRDAVPADQEQEHEAQPASKAALNMLTSQYAKAFPHMRINAVDPGYTATDLNRHRCTKTVEEGAEVILELATLDTSGPTGSFRDAEGVAPW
jgi:NAD(P)-dependent dehydrogenase (short-subunit alcohol dehydrogenase family)